MARRIAQARVWTIFIEFELAEKLSCGAKFRHFLGSKSHAKSNAKSLQNHVASNPKTMSKNVCFLTALLT